MKGMFSFESMLKNVMLFSVLVVLVLMILFDFKQNYNIIFKGTETERLETSVLLLQQSANNTTSQLQSQIMSTGSQTATDNPLITLSTNIFAVVPIVWQTLTYIPSFLLNIVGVAPIIIPDIIITYVVFALVISALFLLINWIRGGLTRL